MKIQLVIYKNKSQKEPFSEWLDTLDTKSYAIIMNRLQRIHLGNFGDSKILKGIKGIWELRIQHGPGYRIYFGKHRFTMVILLIGGDKGSQSRDIAKAEKYWLDYKDQL